MVEKELSLEKIKKKAKELGLEPSFVKGTNEIRFTKSKKDRLKVIDWDEFEKTLIAKKLAVYETGGWMEIMKKDSTSSYKHQPKTSLFLMENQEEEKTRKISIDNQKIILNISEINNKTFSTFNVNWENVRKLKITKIGNEIYLEPIIE